MAWKPVRGCVLAVLLLGTVFPGVAGVASSRCGRSVRKISRPQPEWAVSSAQQRLHTSIVRVASMAEGCGFELRVGSGPFENGGWAWEYQKGEMSLRFIFHRRWTVMTMETPTDTWLAELSDRADDSRLERREIRPVPATTEVRTYPSTGATSGSGLGALAVFVDGLAARFPALVRGRSPAPLAAFVASKAPPRVLADVLTVYDPAIPPPLNVDPCDPEDVLGLINVDVRPVVSPGSARRYPSRRCETRGARVEVGPDRATGRVDSRGLLTGGWRVRIVDEAGTRASTITITTPADPAGVLPIDRSSLGGWSDVGLEASTSVTLLGAKFQGYPVRLSLDRPEVVGCFSTTETVPLEARERVASQSRAVVEAWFAVLRGQRPAQDLVDAWVPLGNVLVDLCYPKP